MVWNSQPTLSVWRAEDLRVVHLGIDHQRILELRRAVAPPHALEAADALGGQAAGNAPDPWAGP